MCRPADLLSRKIIKAMVAVALKYPAEERQSVIQQLAPLTSRLTTRLLVRGQRRYYG